MAIIAFADRRGLFDNQGNLKPLNEIDGDIAKLLAGIKVQSIGEDGRGTLHKIKVYDKMRALSDLFRNKGLFEKDNGQFGSEHVVILHDPSKPSD